MAEQKYPQPCIRCGECCRAEICEPGMLLIPGVSPPCPALEKRNGKYDCGLIFHTSKYVYPGALSEQLYNKIRDHLIDKFEFGVGCDSKLRCPDSRQPDRGETS